MKLDRSVAPATRDFARLKLPECKEVSLLNGVVLNLIDTGTIDANYSSILWNYGDDKANGNRAVRFVTEMLTQGTSTKSAAEIVDLIDYYGAFMSSSVSTSYSKFEWMCLNEFSDKMLALCKDILSAPLFPEDKFQAIKRRKIKELELNQTRTKFIAQQKLNELMAGYDHPYLKPIKSDEIENVTLDSVKDAWLDGFFNNEIHIFVSGKLTSESIEKITDFALSLRSETMREKQSPPVLMKPEASGEYFIDMPHSKQSSVAIGLPAIRRSHPDYIPLRIAVTALGGYFGSRLMTSVREEQGLTYGINAVLAGTPEGGEICINADCDHSNVKKVLQSINNEMNKLSSELMDETELKRLKSFYRTIIASTLESFKTIGSFYESGLQVGYKPDYFDNQQEILEAFDARKLRDIAQKYFLIDEQRIVIAGKNS